MERCTILYIHLSTLLLMVAIVLTGNLLLLLSDTRHYTTSMPSQHWGIHIERTKTKNVSHCYNTYPPSCDWYTLINLP